MDDYHVPAARLTSPQWLRHFQQNLARDRVDWEKPARFADSTNRRMLESLQAWQAHQAHQRSGTADGHLLAMATKHPELRSDPEYLGAIQGFLQEEQQHGKYLGKYLDIVGIGRKNFDLADWLSRRVPLLSGSLEVWTITVIIVEMIAQFYYAAVIKIAGCQLLTNVCQDILRDQGHHLRFHRERLQSFLQRRGPLLQFWTLRAYGGLFRMIALAIWFGHGYVFQQSGMDFAKYWQMSSERFFQLRSSLVAPQTAEHAI